MEGGQQDGAVELDSEDGMRSSGEKGWESVPAPTAHCKHTNTPWVRVASSLGALGAWIPGVVWFCLGTAWIFRGGRWRLQTCADAETQGLGSKKRKRGMEGRKVHFCKSLGGGSRIPGLHLQLDRLVLPRPTTRLEGGRSEPLGWDFELFDFGPLIGCVGGSKRSSHCLATARVSTGTRPKPSEREPWERSSSHCPVLALVSLPCSLVPSLPGTPVPPCLPRLLHRSRFPTAHPFGIPAVGSWASIALGESDHLIWRKHGWNHRWAAQRWPFFGAQMRRQSAPKKTVTNHLFAAGPPELVLNPGDLWPGLS